MANIRINALPADATPSLSDVVAIDQATTRKATIQDVCDVGVPIASTPEAEAGTDTVKRMTPATTAAAIATRGAALFATQSQGDLADTAVQPGDLATVATTGDYGDLSNKPVIPDTSNLVVNTRAITSGTGLTGGGNLTADRSLALSAGSIASLALADTAVQPGALGALAAKNQIAVLDVNATGTPSASTFYRGDGSWGVPSGAGDLLAANNLSDLANAATARTNLVLGNVNNTSDANKPVSTATQTALNLKADLASPALTGTPTAPTAAAGTNTTQAATTAFVTTATTKNVAIMTASGNFTVPAGIRSLDVQLWAGGGGGGSVASGTQPAAGGGGGGYSRGTLTVTPGQIIAAAVGAAGAAGTAGGNGGTGGSTSFSTLSATGGVGGLTPTTGTGGAGGTGSGGTVNLTAAGGGSTTTTGVVGGAGGGSPLGGAGGASSYAAGYGGATPGGGGSGRGAATTGDGSAGGAGLIIITY